MRKFPKEILVTWDEESDVDFPVVTDVEAAAQVSESVKVARYKLVEVGTVTAKPEYRKAGA